MMIIKKFKNFIYESRISIDCDNTWSQIIRDTPELSNLISSRKIELIDNKIFFDKEDSNTVEILNTYLGINPSTKK